jgi:2-keto-3-deoxy-L-rhamnonate aldolase RhmA
MAGYEEENGVAAPHAEVVGLSAGHPLAREIAAATGLDTVVIEGHPDHPDESPSAGALRAAMAALEHFRPIRAVDSAEATIEHIDEVLGENTVRGDE